MKVLVVCVPAAGHLNPLLPLVSALVAQGDHVVVASGAAAADAATGAGAEFRLTGSGVEVWYERLVARTRGAPGDGLPPGRIHHYFLPRLFGEIGADDMVDAALGHGRDLRPDVVLFDTEAFAAPLVAELLGVPAVQHLLGLPFAPDELALVTDAVSPLWRSFGVDVPPAAGVFRHLTLAVFPPSLGSPAEWPGEVAWIRSTPAPVTAERPRRPLVYVTLGTVMNTAMSVFRAIVDGLADEPVDVLVTVGADNDPAGLGPVPPNTQVERFVPQAELMPRCAAVVHHAGSGTMLGALAHGLPQVAVPQGADNFVNAAALAAAGAAEVLPPGEVTAVAARAAVTRVLADPSYRTAAARAAAEIAAMPTPEEVAADLRRRYG